MRVGIPVGAYHDGNPAQFLAAALRKAGHEAVILNQWDWFAAASTNRFDLFFAVDSGGALNFVGPEVRHVLNRTAFWDIDYRRNKGQRAPTDLENVRALNLGGGWVFQAQYEDFIDCLREGLARVSYLPLAADPDVWFYNPDGNKGSLDVGFIGNVWDNQRQAILSSFEQAGLRTTFAIAPPGSVWNESAARLLNMCKIGFNISSFFGEATCYDVNMRVYETLSCGLPLITNETPGIKRIFGGVPFVLTYRTLNEADGLVKRSVEDYKRDPQRWIELGRQAREWLVEFGTYDLRVEAALVALKNQGVI